ncbi:MAG TPA: LysR substrate-binding domain-containing protein [Steroidobacteraceae bacterium]|nr:LysR substrate-binding domain-containing protein [Steroidobacteraceae bacterium]
MISSRDPSLLALRAFEAAARRLSFTEAAEELHVSQAAISRHVRLLEAELGRPLFRRLHRRVVLTAPGQRLASDLAIGFSQLHRAVETVRDISTRELRISVERAFAARWLVPRLGGFSAAYPDIDIDFESSDEVRVLGRDTDVAIRFLSSTSRQRRGRGRKLFPLESFPIIANRRAGRVARRSDSDVLGYRLLHDDDGSAWRSWFAAAGLKGFEEAKHLHFNDYSLVLTAALKGQGVALTAPIYIGSKLKMGRLIRLGRTSVTSGEYWLLEATDRGSARARAAFVGWINAESKGLASGERA